MRGKILISLTSLLVGAAGVFLLMTGSLVVVEADCPADQCDNLPCCNGDVNADGNWDIADAVYLLGARDIVGVQSGRIGLSELVAGVERWRALVLG